MLMAFFVSCTLFLFNCCVITEMRVEKLRNVFELWVFRRKCNMCWRKIAIKCFYDLLVEIIECAGQQRLSRAARLASCARRWYHTRNTNNEKSHEMWKTSKSSRFSFLLWILSANTGLWESSKIFTTFEASQLSQAQRRFLRKPLGRFHHEVINSENFARKMKFI